MPIGSLGMNPPQPQAMVGDLGERRGEE